jgi:hypothetical protein
LQTAQAQIACESLNGLQFPDVQIISAKNEMAAPEMSPPGAKEVQVCTVTSVIGKGNPLRCNYDQGRFLLPSRYDADELMCWVVFNRVTAAIAKIAKDDDLPLAPFTVHDLRRTAFTLLNEVGFNSDWIEKCLAHEHGRTVRGVYNKAEYEPQRRHMMQEWANMVDAWINGQKYTAAFMPPAVELVAHDPLA